MKSIMTKHFLTALLIAGFSVAAKAEPTVYYCNTTAYAQVDASNVSDIRSYPFKLFVDLEQGKVKIAGDVNFATEITRGEGHSAVDTYGNSDDLFFAYNIVESMVFDKGSLTLTSQVPLANGEPFIIAAVARCDKF